ncbi:hypothetical protein CAC42_174 [Sphaceloma murrayae]|uniref:SnoaL-like domain-containing protein n=1 Tax=Sphaceloma murrayae TaxID=2082308 RepID=A0A2K1QNK1_9PEZI|nr:hypothetical protein CAC42_174 [Sphaceloma murrayae]
MQLRSILSSAVALVALAAPALASPPSAAPFCPPRPASPQEQRKIFNDFVDAFIVRKDFSNTTWNTYIAEDYIQHNPFALSGRDQVIAFFANVDPAAVNYTIISKGMDGNYGYIHYRFDQVNVTQPSAVADIFRFNGSCIQEHWDVIQQRPENPLNPIALF